MPDIFTKAKRSAAMSAGNRAFWKAKLARNTERDRLATRTLCTAGWTVQRIWEHDLAAKHWPRVAGPKHFPTPATPRPPARPVRR